MNLTRFDESRKMEADGSAYGEAVRLANELRAKPAHTEITQFGERIDHPAISGFDVETCELKVIQTWLNALNLKRSQSLVTFLHRIIAIRFPDKYSNLKGKIEQTNFNEEFELIQAAAKNEVEWFGEVGFQNMVRLDGSINNNNVRAVKINDRFKFVRK